jgi:hypothetical protein
MSSSGLPPPRLDEQKRRSSTFTAESKPGGWFLVDVRGSSHDWATGWPGDTGSTALVEYRALYEPVLTSEPAAWFNSGFLMRNHERTGGPDCRLPAA